MSPTARQGPLAVARMNELFVRPGRTQEVTAGFVREHSYSSRDRLCSRGSLGSVTPMPLSSSPSISSTHTSGPPRSTSCSPPSHADSQARVRQWYLQDSSLSFLQPPPWGAGASESDGKSGVRGARELVQESLGPRRQRGAGFWSGQWEGRAVPWGLGVGSQAPRMGECRSRNQNQSRPEHTEASGKLFWLLNI